MSKRKNRRRKRKQQEPEQWGPATAKSADDGSPNNDGHRFTWGRAKLLRRRMTK